MGFGYIISTSTKRFGRVWNHHVNMSSYDSELEGACQVLTRIHNQLDYNVIKMITILVDNQSVITKVTRIQENFPSNIWHQDTTNCFTYKNKSNTFSHAKYDGNGSQVTKLIIVWTHGQTIALTQTQMKAEIK